MRRKTLMIRALVLAVLVTVAGAPTIVHAKCFKWSDARSVISKNKLLTGKQILQRIKSRYSGKSTKVNLLELCEEGGQFVYRAVLIDRKSKAKNIMLNARTGGTASLKASTFSRAGKKESATDEAKKIINKLCAK